MIENFVNGFGSVCISERLLFALKNKRLGRMEEVTMMVTRGER